MPELKSLYMLLAITVVAAGATWYIKDQIYNMHHVTDTVAVVVADSNLSTTTPVAEPDEVLTQPTVPAVTPKPPVTIPREEPVIAGACAVGGCSSQLCGEAADMDGMVTTCEYREVYACYQTATCERQATGKCGWTDTPELAMCLKTNS